MLTGRLKRKAITGSTGRWDFQNAVRPWIAALVSVAGRALLAAYTSANVRRLGAPAPAEAADPATDPPAETADVPEWVPAPIPSPRSCEG